MTSSLQDAREPLIARLLVVLLAVFVIFEIFALVGWLVLPFPSLLPNGQWRETMSSFTSIESTLFFSLEQFAPILLVGLLATGLIGLLRLVLGFFKKRTKIVLSYGKTRKGVDDVLARLRSSLDGIFDPAGAGSRLWVLVLALSVLVVSCVAIYPYLPGLNPNGRLVGADVPVYVGWLMEMGKNGTSNVFIQALFDLPSRSLSVVLMYVGWMVSGVSIEQFFQVLPLFLGLMLVLVTFFFARKAGFNAWAASLVSLFTAFSFQVTVGMFGGFFSNWVGLIFLYLSWGFLFWSLRRGSWSLLGAAALFQIGVLFAHVETWEMTIGILAVFLIVTFARSLKNKNGLSDVKMLFTFLVASAVAGVVRSIALGNSFAFTQAGQLSQAHLSLDFAGQFWILDRTLQIEMGISFMNPVLLLLAFVGGLVLAFDDRLVSRFLNACIVAATVPFIFGDWFIQPRILYDLPVQVLACVGLLVLLKLTGSLVEKRREAAMIKGLLLVLVVLVNVNYALRCSFNLPYLP